MRPSSFDKGSILLFVIIGLVVAFAGFLILSLRSDSVEEAIKSDRILNVLFVVEMGEKPSSTQLFLFYPSNGRGAVLDVPAETGLILKSVNRMDGIGSVYERGRPKAFLEETARLLGADLSYWIVLDEEELAATIDLLEGLELFLPNSVAEKGPPRVLLPQGAVVLDGGKLLQYAGYRPPDEDEAEAAGRRQKLFQSLIRRIGEKAEWIIRPDVFPSFRKNIDTNLTEDALRRLVKELGKLDADRLVLQRVTGTWRTVEGKRLVFPHFDGELVRDIVKQTLNALSASGQSTGDKIYTLEILNGTPSKGLASRTAEIFQSFGYDVISVGNADRDDFDRTVIIDSFSNPEAAKNVAEVIHCRNLSTEAAAGSEVQADFTIVLGKDFNGRYCSANEP